MEKIPTVYIMANRRYGAIYVGITTDLVRRVSEHKSGLILGFTAQYKCNKLVFYTSFQTPIEAIEAEKKLKGGSRLRKTQLIEATNPTWKDLSSHF